MSVPAHAPYDYLALTDLYNTDLTEFGLSQDLRQIEIISLIEVPGYGEFPAVEAVKELNVRDQNDPRPMRQLSLFIDANFITASSKQLQANILA